MNLSDGYSILAAITALSVRALGMICFLPLGEEHGAVITKLCLAFVIGWFFLGTVEVSESLSLYLLVLEFFVGLFVGLPVSIFVSLASMCGELFDSGRGQTMGSIYDPFSYVSLSLTSGLCRYLLWALFLAHSLLSVLFSQLAESYRLLPPGTLSVGTFSLLGYTLLLSIGKMIGLCFFYYLPLGVIFLLVDIGIALISRILPHGNIQGESYFLKNLCAYFVLINLSDCCDQVALALLSTSSQFFPTLF